MDVWTAWGADQREACARDGAMGRGLAVWPGREETEPEMFREELGANRALTITRAKPRGLQTGRSPMAEMGRDGVGVCCD